MFRATLKSLLAHKLRLALTAIAIVLGVAFMAATFVLTDTVKHSFDTLFAQTAVGKDLVVRAVAPYGNSSSGRDFGGAVRPPVPDSLVAKVKAVPGVRDASGLIMGQVTVIKADGKPLKKNAPVFGANYSPDRALSSFLIATGRGPATANEIAMDVNTVKSEHFALGGTVSLITNKGPGKFTLVGTETFGKNNSLLGATVVSFETRTAQQLVGRPGYFDEIEVANKPGVALDAEMNAIGSALPPNGYEVVTATAAASQQAKQVEQFINYFHTFLLVFALIALFVGAFLIANTFSILIGQRTRELALLRALGASRAQVVRSLIGESLATGLFGSIIGLLLGVPLASGIYAFLKAVGFGPPATAMQVLPRTIYLSLGVGTLITLVSAVGPAVRGSRIPPVAAMRDDAVVAEVSLRRRAIVGGSVLGIGILLLFIGLFSSGSAVVLVGVGAALTFVGVAALAPFIAGRMARTIGAPLPALRGVTGRLGQENAARNPKRTAGTASSLMVGLGLVAAIATLGASLQASFGAIMDRGLKADYVIGDFSRGPMGFSPAAKTALLHRSDVTALSPYSEIDVHENSSRKQVAGVDPVNGPKVFNIVMVTGSVGALGKNQILVDEPTASSRHLKVGDVLHLGFTATGVKPVVVGGTFKQNQFLDRYVISYDMLVANSPPGAGDEGIFVNTTSRTPAEAAALTAALSGYPNLKVQTAAQFKADRKKMLTTFLYVAYALLLLSILIASFSVVNTMALSVIERTHEIGLLRAIGMGRRQVRAMIRGEAVIVALLGAVLGVVIGVGLGSAIVTAVGQTGSGVDKLAIPGPTIVIVLILAGVIGVVAAVFPARRAAKLDVLQAIATG